jgi:O-antigen biosynthesis protein
VPESRGTRPEIQRPNRGRPEIDHQNRRLFLQRWGDRALADSATQWRAAGFETAHYQPANTLKDEGVPEPPLPVILRRAGRVTEGPAEGMPALRWAIKVGVPVGPAGRKSEDWVFAKELAEALRRLGQSAVVDGRESAYRESRYLDDVNLMLRGSDRVRPDPGRVNLLWVTGSATRVEPDEPAQFDAVFGASERCAAIDRAEELFGDLDAQARRLLDVAAKFWAR